MGMTDEQRRALRAAWKDPERRAAFYKRIGESLRAARERAGMTPAQVEQIAGIKAHTIVAIEEARYHSSITQVEAIANAIGARLDIVT